jgi:hypothetical protein
MGGAGMQRLFASPNHVAFLTRAAEGDKALS